MKREAALSEADFGHGTAEQDEALWGTFVETDLWTSMLNGKVDVIIGAKGSGKSAIYARLFKKSDALRRRGVELIGAENLIDDPVFHDLPNIPSLTGRQFIGLWKLYFLTLVGDKLRRLQVNHPSALDVISRLEDAGLLPKGREERLVELFQRVLRYVQFDLEVDIGGSTPALLPVKGDVQVKGKITLHEPTPEETQHGVVSVHYLFRSAGEALEKRRLTFWIMVDRLDIAFPSVDELLEAKALRALIQTYIDLLIKGYRLSLKLFLRDDVWDRIINKPGDPIVGANSLQYRTIRWHDQALISLLARRISVNKGICDLYSVKASKIQGDYRLQLGVVSRVLPEVVRPNQRDVSTINWILQELRDGTGHVAPREVILLLIFAREIQLDRMGLKIATFTSEEMFESATLTDAIRRVSEFRLFQTLCLEYPYLVISINRLRGTESKLSVSDLTFTWREPPDSVRQIAGQLMSLGFFIKHGNESEEIYEVAPLYRPGLAVKESGRVSQL
jgi:hypothetical protein